mgnify:CR=1 FL=1
MTIVVAMAGASCGGATSSAATCDEYAAELAGQARSGASPEEVAEFVEDTSEHVANLIAANPEDAQACADAVIEAVLSTGLADFSEDFQD